MTTSTPHLANSRIDRSANLLVPGLLLGVAACTAEARAEGDEAPALPVSVTPVRHQDQFELTRVFAGTVRSHRASQLGFERPGKLDRVLVEEGLRVAKGDSLAVLDTRQLRVARRRVQAALTRAKAQRGLSDLTADRVEALAKKAFAPAQQADEARFGRDAARATVNELEASLAQIAVDLEKSTLRAPFSGLVTAQLLDEGTVVPAGAPVLRLQGREGKEASVGVALADARSLKVGATVIVEVGGAEGPGTVTGLVEDLDPRTRTLGVVISLPSELNAVDGDVARLMLTRSQEHRGAWLPLTALTQGAKGTWTVYALPAGQAEGTLRREAVTVVHQDQARAFVQGTLSEGDQVVAVGAHRVVAGQRARVAGKAAR